MSCTGARRRGAKSEARRPAPLLRAARLLQQAARRAARAAAPLCRQPTVERPDDEMSADDEPHDSSSSSDWSADLAAGVGRAALRVRHTLLSRARATRVSALKAAKNLDRLSTAADASDVARGVSEDAGGLTELYKRKGGVGVLRSVALPFATAALSGTALFAAYEEAVELAGDRPGTHVAAGAVGGVAFACTTQLLNAVSTGEASRGARLLMAHLPKACVADGAEWAVSFATYDATKHWLLEAPVPAGDEHEDVAGSEVAAIAAAGAAAGVSQSAVNQLVHSGRFSIRAALRAAPLAGVGFAAWELGRATATHRDGG